MPNWEIGFDSPWWPAYLVATLVIWVMLVVWSYRSLAGLGQFRRMAALLFRAAIVGLIMLCLAEAQWRLVSDKVTVIYLLDQSDSIPTEDRNAMLTYVRQEVRRHRNATSQDRAGVITFARESAIEIPPFDSEIVGQQSLETSMLLNKDATNLASALKLAQASFPEDASKRIVIVTDGNENVGDAKAIARQLAEDGVGIDVVPIRLFKGAEIAIERVVIPSNVREGNPFDVRVVVANYAQPGEGDVDAKLRVFRNDQLLVEKDVSLAPGKNVFAFPENIERPQPYTYRAEISAADPARDYSRQNNEASAFTYVQGKGRVLFIVNPESPGDYDGLIEALGREKLEVTKRAGGAAFNTLADLQAFDTVVLANVPRSSGEGPDGGVVGFTDDQIKQLVANTENLGCGLVMLGGEESFGCGGWTNTELERIMPVDFQIKNAEVKKNGALVLLMHASELAQGNYWQKVVAMESIKTLGPTDYCGVLHWDDFTGGDNWLWKNAGSGLQEVGGNKKSMLSKVDRMQPGDMPQFEPAMQKALTAFKGVAGKAAVKHMIIISDGDPSPPNRGTVTAFANAKIVISTVAIGTHGPAGSTPLKDIATATGGKYYVVTNPKALPTIYNKEVRRIARPLILEDKTDGLAVNMASFPHEMLSGIEGPLPRVNGFVMTTVKENPLVEVSLSCEKPDNGGPNSTILASWTYKAGRTVAFTTDAGHRWAKSYTEWPNYSKFFGQMIRWSMRPANEQGKFTVATEAKDGKMRIVVNALDNDDRFLNNLAMSATATAPDLKSAEIVMRQEAPGRYVGEIDADRAGSYFIAVNPGKGYGALLTGANVPYSSEYRDRQHNQSLLETLAKFKPAGGDPGQVIAGALDREDMEPLLATDTFRRTLKRAVSVQDVWPWLALLAACLFVGDVFVRRVAFDEWFIAGWQWLRQKFRRGANEPARDERMERLRSRKANVGGQIDERRAATRFAPESPDSAASSDAAERLAQAAGERPDTSSTSAKPTPTTTPSAPNAEDKTYTDRLLEAKRKARKDRQDGG